MSPSAASAFVILSFYGVVGGWTLKYTILAISGGFDALSGQPDISGKVFSEFIGSSFQPIIWQLLFMSFCIGIIIKGVKSGIESGAKIMMPLILVILGLLVFKGLSLEGGKKGLEFLFKPKFSDLNPSSIVDILEYSRSIGVANFTCEDSANSIKNDQDEYTRIMRAFADGTIDYDTMSKNCVSRWERQATPELITQQHLDLYKELL